MIPTKYYQYERHAAGFEPAAHYHCSAHHLTVSGIKQKQRRHSEEAEKTNYISNGRQYHRT